MIPSLRRYAHFTKGFFYDYPHSLSPPGISVPLTPIDDFQARAGTRARGVVRIPLHTRNNSVRARPILLIFGLQSDTNHVIGVAMSDNGQFIT